MIEFFCPHGHKIRCGAEQAGKPAKCPRCGARFLIPAAEAGPEGAPPTAVATAELSDSQVGSSASSLAGGSHARSAASESQIEFLCPNGHHLHGPSSLQGRPGECPECGSRFRIPVLAELDLSVEGTSDEPEAGEQEPEEEAAPEPTEEEMAAEKEEEQISLAGLSSLGTRESADANAPGESPGGPSPRPSSRKPLEESPPSDLFLTAADSALASGHRTAQLFARLWTAKVADSRVEVHLESGGVLLPDGFLHELSARDVAVLVTKDPDGSYTLNAVPWHTVVRVIVRGIRELPGEVTW